MADFKTAVLITMDKDHEGGFQKMYHDRGNWTGGAVGVGELRGTNCGISAAQYPTLDIENLTQDEIVNLYREGYWKKHYSEIDSQPIANKLFDLGVLSGVGTAVKLLQEMVSVTVDGGFGPNTLLAVNGADETSLLAAYKTRYVQHVLAIASNKPAERIFVHDWITRINS